MHWLKQTDKHKDRTSSKKTYFKPRIVKNTNTTQSPGTKTLVCKIYNLVPSNYHLSCYLHKHQQDLHQMLRGTNINLHHLVSPRVPLWVPKVLSATS